MKLLFDFFPVIVFFVAFKAADIYWATGAAIAATLAQIAYLKLRGRRIPGMLWGSLVVVGVFGGATLLLRDETFIKWKPTVLYWLAGIVFLGALAFRQNLVKTVMSEGGLELPEPVWKKLAIAWGIFFLFKGTLNLWVAHAFSTETWVNFKLFGGMGLMLAFVIAQALWISRYLPEDKPVGKPQPAPAKGEGP